MNSGKEARQAELNGGSHSVERFVGTITVIGELGGVLAKLIFLLPLFALTAKSLDETMGDWHVRIFKKPLFLRPNSVMNKPSSD